MDLIDRQAAIAAIYACYIGGKEAVDKAPANDQYAEGIDEAVRAIEDLPSVEPEQAEMIKEIREWINSGNRGSADYFIVDKIEEIINKYE